MLDSIDSGGMCNRRGKRAKGTRPMAEITVLGLGLCRGACATDPMGAFIVDDENGVAGEIIRAIRVRQNEEPGAETDEQGRRNGGAVNRNGQPARHGTSSLSAARGDRQAMGELSIEDWGRLKIDRLLQKDD